MDDWLIDGQVGLPPGDGPVLCGSLPLSGIKRLPLSGIRGLHGDKTLLSVRKVADKNAHFLPSPSPSQGEGRRSPQP
jgi:hypothetical protein